MCIFQGNRTSAITPPLGTPPGLGSRRNALVWAALFFVVSTTAGAQPAPPDRGSSAPATLPKGQQLASKDASFMKEVAQNNHAEIESSQLALQKATNAQVKAFAQQMVDDHGTTEQALASLAAAKGVALPDGPSLLQKAHLKLLRATDGENFDRFYAESMGVRAHVNMIKLFQEAAEQARDPDVKAFATKTLPALQHHLEMAQALPVVEKARESTTR